MTKRKLRSMLNVLNQGRMYQLFDYYVHDGWLIRITDAAGNRVRGGHAYVTDQKGPCPDDETKIIELGKTRDEMERAAHKNGTRLWKQAQAMAQPEEPHDLTDLSDIETGAELKESLKEMDLGTDPDLDDDDDDLVTTWPGLEPPGAEKPEAEPPHSKDKSAK